MTLYDSSPFAHLMPSERNAPPELNIVNEQGEEMVEHYGRYYTREEWAIEAQGRHDWWQAYKDREEAQRIEIEREREQEDIRYRELQSRRDGIMPFSEAQYEINSAYYTDPQKRKGQTKDEEIPYMFVWWITFLCLGLGALMVGLSK